MSNTVEGEGTPTSNNGDVPHSFDTREGIEKLYNIYNQNKDNELERFWKNSMFVWTFIAICFTAYGTIILNFKDINSDLFANCSSYFLLFTSVFGLSLSIIWFWMAKALKIRFKVNEVPVWKMENIDNIFGINDKNLFAFNYTWYKNKPYSPSKLVIGLGILLIAFWIMLLLFSILTFWFDDKDTNTKETIKLICLIAIIVFIVTILIITLVIGLSSKFKSSNIRKECEQEVFKEVKQFLIGKGQLRYFEVKDHKVILFYTKDEIDNNIHQNVEQFFNKDDFANYDEMENARYVKYIDINDIKNKFNYDRTQNKPTHSA